VDEYVKLRKRDRNKLSSQNPEVRRAASSNIKSTWRENQRNAVTGAAGNTASFRSALLGIDHALQAATAARFSQRVMLNQSMTLTAISEVPSSGVAVASTLPVIFKTSRRNRVSHRRPEN
jgi:hypothetical protein